MSDSFLDMLRAGTKACKTITWPGTDIKVELRVANDQDRFEASLAADRIFSGAGIDIKMQNIDAYEAEKATQLLWRVLQKPGCEERVAHDIADFRRLLRDGVREKIAAEHTAWQQECSPDPYEMSDDEFESLLLSVKKNAEKTLSSVTNIFVLRKLSAIMAKDLPS